MSRPSIFLPPLPPNRFFHPTTLTITLITLALTNTSLAAPFPKGGGGGGRGGSGGSRGGKGSHPVAGASASGSGSSSSDHHLTKGQSIALACGIIFGIFFFVLVVIALTNLDRIRKKREAWKVKRKGNSGGGEVSRRSADESKHTTTTQMKERSDVEWVDDDAATTVNDGESTYQYQHDASLAHMERFERKQAVVVQVKRSSSSSSVGSESHVALIQPERVVVAGAGSGNGVGSGSGSAGRTGRAEWW